MLFYERRKKKDMKVLVPEDKVEEAKDSGIDVTYDEEKKEHSKLVKYKESVDNEAPNEIYKKVFEDNKKFTFENDIYSQEFFGFLLQVLSSATTLEGKDADEIKLSALRIGQKAGFEILARCYVNQGIKDVA